MSFQHDAFQHDGFQVQLDGSAATAALDEEGQGGFVSIPLAIAKAGLAVAVAIAGTFNYQDDLPRVNLAPAADSVQILAIGENRVQQPFLDSDEFVAAAAPTIVEEDYWQQPEIKPPRAVQQPAQENDELSPKLDEDHLWAQPTPVQRPSWQAFSYDDDIVPQPAEAFTQEDDWQIYVPGLARPVVFVWQGDEEVTTQPVFIPEEDYWQTFTTDRTEVVILGWQTAGGGGNPQESVVLESDWQVYTPSVPRPIVVVQQQDDEIVPQPVALEKEDADWQVYTPPLQAAKRIYLPDPEEIPAGNLVSLQSTDISSFDFAAGKVNYPVHISWAANDELPVFELRPEEDYWQVFTPQPPKPLVTVWAEDDQIVPQPLPLELEEEDWRLWTPAYPKPIGLYLPDPEEYPELVATPVVVVPDNIPGWLFPPRNVRDVRKTRRLELGELPPEKEAQVVEVVKAAGVIGRKRAETGGSGQKSKELAKQQAKYEEAFKLVYLSVYPMLVASELQEAFRLAVQAEIAAQEEFAFMLMLAEL